MRTGGKKSVRVCNRNFQIGVLVNRRFKEMNNANVIAVVRRGFQAGVLSAVVSAMLGCAPRRSRIRIEQTWQAAPAATHSQVRLDEKPFAILLFMITLPLIP